ncbi:MAG: protein translocase SEC61 complex subunit gamma [Candidatus Woesearchaeota archaeon]
MKVKEFITESKRVLRITRKPDSFEFKTTMKVAGAGILLIGLVGFILLMIKHFIGTGF